MKYQNAFSAIPQNGNVMRS